MYNIKLPNEKKINKYPMATYCLWQFDFFCLVLAIFFYYSFHISYNINVYICCIHAQPYVIPGITKFSIVRNISAVQQSNNIVTFCWIIFIKNKNKTINVCVCVIQNVMMIVVVAWWKKPSCNTNTLYLATNFNF